jgi:hypothetical protein
MAPDTTGAANATGEGAGGEGLNLGSARSDYGERAYGGSLDESGVGGRSVDDFAEGRVDRGSRGYEIEGEDFRSRGAGSGNLWMLLAGIGIGAGLMYLLDPERGSARRKMVGDKLVAWTNDLTDAAGATARDLRDRAKGVVPEARGAVQNLSGGAGRAGTDSSSQQGGQAAE